MILVWLACSAPEVIPAPPPVEWNTPEPSLTLHANAFQRWPSHSILKTAADGVNLRAAPRVDAMVVRRLEMGTELRVLEETGAATEVGGRENLWYRVSHRDGESSLGGFVFGSTLTPIAFPIGSGQLVATFSPDRQPRIRLGLGDETPARDLGPPGPGGTLRVGLEESLIRAELCNGADCEVWWVTPDRTLDLSEGPAVGAGEATSGE